jgi:DUF4097 and DUF4098 domain-containing protein YvlB
MATLPPPYSQRDAARAQRYYRRSLRRPSLLGPVVLIVVGVIALLVETNQLNAVHLWDWYIRWWPLLLIGVGLLSLGEWWLDGRRGNVGRRSHGGLVGLIIFLAILGYMVNRSNHFHGMHLFGHGVEEDDVFSHLFGQEHDADRNLNREIPAASLVDIQVPHGDVTVTPSGDDQIHVQAHQVVYASNDRDARRNLDALAPQLTVNGKNVTLRAADASNGRADLTIEIPNGAVPTVTAGHGDVTIEGLTGDANVAAERGDVKVDNLGGGAHVHMSKGEFSAHAIQGELSLQGRLDDVSISDVQGRVALDGDFFGDTDLAHIAAPVHFHSSRTDLEVASIPGDLSIDSGDLQLNNATGPARISTSAKDVECTGIAGDLHVEDGDGDISVGAIAPVGELQIHNRNGAIHLTVPQGAGFQLQATARNGNIDSKLDLPVISAGEGQSINGKVGAGGPRIELVADHGDIEITGMEPVPPEPPTPPTPPTPPGPPVPGSKPPRHLRPSKSPGGDGGTSGQPVVQ